MKFAGITMFQFLKGTIKAQVYLQFLLDLYKVSIPKRYN